MYTHSSLLKSTSYGGINFGINSEIPWVFESFQDVVTNMGILLYTLCFSFLLFPLYVCVQLFFLANRMI